jgi:hypothetical protein
MPTDNLEPYDPTKPSKEPVRWLGLPARDDLPPEVREEMELARRDPGPTWRQWFFFSAAKWWLGLAFLIVDTWIIVSALTAPVGPAIAILAVALYLEVVAWQYLWHRPPSATLVRRRSNEPNRWWWIRPVPVGRWTPEAEQARLHRPVSGAGDQAPDPREFL